MEQPQKQQITDQQAVQILNARLTVAVNQRNQVQDQLVQVEASLQMLSQQMEAVNKLLEEIKNNNREAYNSAIRAVLPKEFWPPVDTETKPDEASESDRGPVENPTGGTLKE